MAERRTRNAQVPGSIPGLGSSKYLREKELANTENGQLLPFKNILKKTEVGMAKGLERKHTKKVAGNRL